MKKKIRLVMVLMVLTAGLMGCQRQADKVSYNLSKEADNFNDVRQITSWAIR